MIGSTTNPNIRKKSNVYGGINEKIKLGFILILYNYIKIQIHGKQNPYKIWQQHPESHRPIFAPINP